MCKYCNKGPRKNLEYKQKNKDFMNSTVTITKIERHNHGGKISFALVTRCFKKKLVVDGKGKYEKSHEWVASKYGISHCPKCGFDLKNREKSNAAKNIGYARE